MYNILSNTLVRGFDILSTEILSCTHCLSDNKQRKYRGSQLFNTVPLMWPLAYGWML